MLPLAHASPTRRVLTSDSQAGSKMVVNILKTLPEELQQATEANRNVVNHPTAGCFGNYMGPNVQLNISTASRNSGGGKGECTTIPTVFRWMIDDYRRA
jgi:hypothetical protein